MIREEIEKILNRYDDGKRYSQYRYEENDEGNEIEFKVEDELKEFCETNNVNYKYQVEDAYDSCGYECVVGAIAFIDENSELQLMTVLYEYF